MKQSLRHSWYILVGATPPRPLVSHRPHVSVLSYVKVLVLTTSHCLYPLFSFVMVTCVPIVSFLASCQGMTRYCVRVEAPLGLP